MPLKLIYLHEPDIQVSYYLHLPSFKLHHKYIIVFIVVIQKYFLCFVFDHQSVFERVIRQEPVGLMTRILFSRYHFRILDSFGWNFRHAHFHGLQRGIFLPHVNNASYLQRRAGGPCTKLLGSSLWSLCRAGQVSPGNYFTSAVSSTRKLKLFRLSNQQVLQSII